MKELIDLFGNQKYRRIIFLTIFISITCMVAASYELITTYQSEVRRAQIQSSNLSQVLEVQMSGMLKKIDLVMFELSRTIRIESSFSRLGRRELKKLFDERRKNLPEAGTFTITDERGYERFTNTVIQKLYIGDREHFIYQSHAAGDDLYISKPLLSRVTGEPTIFLARKMTNMKNKFIGVISTGIPLTYFRDLYGKLDIGEEGAITLFSNENIVYSRFPWDTSMVGKKLNNQDIVDYLFSRNDSIYSSILKSKFDGLDRYTSSRRIPDTKFMVSVGISKNEVLAHWKRRVTFYFCGFLVLWSCSLIYLFNFLKSLQELENRRKIALQTAKLTSLGEMAAGIAHEINNPLAVISTRAIQLKKQIERDQYEPEAFKASLVKINQTVDRIAKIIKGLKSFSRDTDSDPYIATSLNSIVQNALELCNERFRHEMVILKVDPIPDLYVECREAQLVQVILNLLGNAYDALENTGEKWVHLKFNQTCQRKFVFSVIDSGKGICEKDAEKIMQPFFTTKEIGKGTGLGLSISKGIIEDHHGKLFLDRSNPHTCFVIELPAVAQISKQSTPVKRAS